MSEASRIALGTVQFGLGYGVNNKRGIVPASEVGSILSCAWKHGVDTLDTAHAYGISERILGDLLCRSDSAFKIVTKLDPSLTVNDSFRDSLARLQRPAVYGCLVHNYAHYQKAPYIWVELQELKAQGLVERIGFSLYHPSELERLLDASLNFDIIQLPYSVFDQRFEPYFHVLAKSRVEIHVRSVFLQGLVFMSPAELPSSLVRAATKLRELQSAAAAANLSIASICLQFVLSRREVDRVLVGVDSLENLVQNIEAVSHDALSGAALGAVERLAIDDEQIIVPSNWGK